MNYIIISLSFLFIYGIGPILTATLPDKQHTLWLHGNTLLKPMHSVTAPNANLASEYAEVAQIMPKVMNVSAPPEPYATVRSEFKLFIQKKKKMQIFKSFQKSKEEFWIQIH